MAEKITQKALSSQESSSSMDCGSNEGFASQRFRFHYGDHKESTVELWVDPLRKP